MKRRPPKAPLESLPPHDEKAEAGALGCILTNEPDSEPGQLLAQLSPDLFYNSVNLSILRTLKDLNQQGAPLNLQILIHKLSANADPDSGDLINYVRNLPSQTPSYLNFPYYLDILTEFARRRAAVHDAACVEEIARNTSLPPNSVSSAAKNLLIAHANNGDSSPIAARPLSDFLPPSDQDPDELLKYRFLCRGGGLLLVGPTGAGKSSLLLQALILWSLGLPAFGIIPAKPLSSLLIQAENDDGDLAEMRDGVFNGLQIPPDSVASANASVLVHKEDFHSGPSFFLNVVSPLLDSHHPDILAIDPALSFIGGESNSQADVGAFLRNGINPLIHKHKCAAIIAHHSNKPPSGHEKPNWQAGDFAYLGAGSAEWCNWARAVLALRSVGSHQTFELLAGKRGARLRWTNPDDNSLAFNQFISHSPSHICWLPSDPSQIPPLGRPRLFNPNDLLSLLPPSGLSSSDWLDAATNKFDISRASFFRSVRSLQNDRLVLKSALNSFFLPISPSPSN